MMRFLLKIIILFTGLLLMSCTYHHGPGASADLASETWTRSVDVDPAKWTAGASEWFLEGATTHTEQMDRDAPYMAAMSTMMVRVPNDFVNVRVKGNFKVQLFGTNNANSLYMYGPNSAVRFIIVKVHGNTISLIQAKGAPSNMGCVIVRIGMRQLASLTHMGSGTIEGRGVRSHCLTIDSCSCGNIYLAGAMNVTNIKASGSGHVNVFGAVTPELSVTTSGAGSVNVSGNVGIHCITHHGSGDINIIGANSDGLTIHTDGQGKIGLNGRVAINEIDARDDTCVYAYYVNGDTLKVYATDHARIGLAGCTRNLYVDAGKLSRFMGHYLYTNDAYVRAHDLGHVNVMAANKVFASATQNSSVYYFGSPNQLSQFFRENGVVMPILGDKSRARRSYCPYYKRRHMNYSAP